MPSDYEMMKLEDTSVRSGGMGLATMQADRPGSEKLCPVCYIGSVMSASGPSRQAIVCGPRCAWYDADKQRCAVLSLARRK